MLEIRGGRQLSAAEKGALESVLRYHVLPKRLSSAELRNQRYTER